MELSNHARMRQRQRGISLDVINFILENGTEIKKPGNATEIRIPKCHIPQIVKQYKSLVIKSW